MLMTEIFLFTICLVLIFGSRKCQSFLIHFLNWLKEYTLQALKMSLTTLQNMMS